MSAAVIFARELPGTIPLGRIRIPVYGLFATAGVVAAMFLSQAAARRVRISEAKLWDAGLVAVVSAFVASRLLLVAENFKVFAAVPLLVLTLPSLTYGGLLVTVLVTWLYLRVKRLPVLGVLDAWTPGALLLAACLQLGHFFEGTDAGMPTRLPWGVIAPGDTMLGRTQPVQLYAVALALAWLAWAWARLPRRTYDGQVAALTLIAGGAASFLLDMLRQPLDSDLPLQPSQMVAAAAVLCGIGVFVFAPRKEVR